MGVLGDETLFLLANTIGRRNDMAEKNILNGGEKCSKPKGGLSRPKEKKKKKIPGGKKKRPFNNLKGKGYNQRGAHRNLSGRGEGRGKT